MVSTPTQSFNVTQYQPISPIQQTPFSPNTSLETGLFSFSPKHNALYIYLERILRPIWSLNCVRSTPSNSKEYVRIIMLTKCYFYDNIMYSSGRQQFSAMIVF